MLGTARAVGRWYVLNQPVKDSLSLLEPLVESYPFGPSLVDLFKSRYHLLSSSIDCRLLAREVVDLVFSKQDNPASQDDQPQHKNQGDQDSNQGQDSQGGQDSNQGQDSQGDQDSDQDQDGQGDQDSDQDQDGQGDQDSDQDQDSQGDQDSDQDQDSQGDQDSDQDQDSQSDQDASQGQEGQGGQDNQTDSVMQDLPSENSPGWILPFDKGAF